MPQLEWFGEALAFSPGRISDPHGAGLRAFVIGSNQDGVSVDARSSVGGFSVTMRKMRSRTTLGVGLLPIGFLTFEINARYQRNPARCHRTTVLGVTTGSACFQPGQNRGTSSQKTCRANIALSADDAVSPRKAWQSSSSWTKLLTEERKYAILFAATLLSARKLFCCKYPRTV